MENGVGVMRNVVKFLGRGVLGWERVEEGYGLDVGWRCEGLARGEER